MLVLLVNMFLAVTFDLKYFTWKTNEKAIIIVLVEWLAGFSCAVLSCLNCDVDLQKDASVLTYRREVLGKGKPIAPVIISAFVVIAVVLSAMIFGTYLRPVFAGGMRYIKINEISTSLGRIERNPCDNYQKYLM